MICVADMLGAGMGRLFGLRFGGLGINRIASWLRSDSEFRCERRFRRQTV